MFSVSDEERLTRSLNEYSDAKWIWIDVVTSMGPTQFERYFREIFKGDFLHHWSPTYPEGYLEIHNEKAIVVHWILGEKDKVISISPQDEVDFDRIDDTLASTLIQNSVIRIFSEKY